MGPTYSFKLVLETNEQNPSTYLLSYKLVETSFEKTDAFISLPSFNLYMFILNFINELLKF